MMYFYEVRRQFIAKTFDLSNCWFSFTGSPLTKIHRELFSDLGIHYGDHMRCWDGGATYFTCEYGNRHWVDFLAKTRIEPSSGHLIASDLWNCAMPHIEYHNGDVLSSKKCGQCQCGLVIDEIVWED
jgi:hypothetical protein